VDSFFQNIKHYFENRVELIKLDTQEAITKAVSQAIFYVVFSFVFLIFFIFFNLSIALLINYFTESNFWGFVAVTLFYLLVLVVLWLNKAKFEFYDKVEKATANLFTKKNK